MKVLIVKSNINSFERKINKWFLEENNIDVLNFEAENTGISKRLAILSTLKSFRSKHRNNYDKVIVFDDTVFYIYSRLFFSNCYLWFWNTVTATFLHSSISAYLYFCAKSAYKYGSNIRTSSIV